MDESTSTYQQDGDDLRRVVVPPNTWSHIATDHERQEAVELRHTNDRNLVFLIADTGDGPLAVHDADSGPYPAEGWRTRVVPFAEIADDVAQELGIRPAHSFVPDDMLSGHPLVLARQDAEDREALAIHTAIAEGWLIELDTPDDTGARYRLTDEGKRHVEKVLGVPAETLD